jgi:hypothetical protein
MLISIVSPQLPAIAQWRLGIVIVSPELLVSLELLKSCLRYKIEKLLQVKVVTNDNHQPHDFGIVR